VTRLLDGAKPTLLATDPPYGVSLDGSWRDGVYNGLGPAEPAYMQLDGQPEANHVTRTNARRHGRNTTISGDTRVDWSAAFELVPSLTAGYLARRPPCAGSRGRTPPDRLRARLPGDLGQRAVRDEPELVPLGP
jgi:hypothetical protein